MPLEEPSAADPIDGAVLGAVASLVRELGSEEAAERVGLDSALGADLGLGSLERVELLVRVESAVGTRLPEATVQSAETPRDWVSAVRAARGGPSPAARWPITQPAREAHAPPASARTFAEVLRAQAGRDPGRTHMHLLDRDSGKDISHAALLERADRVAAGLLASGLKPGQTVAIMLPTCEEFFSSFLGVVLAGGIAVPIYPPARASQLEQYVRRQSLILRNADVRFLIAFDRIRAVANVLGADLPSLRESVTAPELAERGRGQGPPAADCADIFFVQYTSGSTGDPKGVALTHANVLANVRGIGYAVEVKPSDAVVSWLPLYHDMGLIGSWLFSLYHGLPITILSPLDFLVRPERWLWALSDSGGTLCPAPNFAFELCVRKIGEEAMDGVDLSPWRVAINAGEPVLPATLRRFADRFRPWGFDARSFMPFYGLAESSVALTYPPFWRGPVTDSVDRAAFEEHGRAVPASPDVSDRVLEFVGNGKPLPGHEVRVVGEDGACLPERVRGRIVFRGPSRTGGYFRNPQATAAVLDADGWMDSGDLGYLADGELYVTGRLKDCIIKGGRNLIPQDIEMAAWAVRGVRKGCVAAFGSVDSGTGTERLVVVVETRATGESALAGMRSEVAAAVEASIGLPPDDVVLVGPGTIPKTSSGKLQRLETRRMYEDGSVTAQAPSAPWVQMARLWGRSAVPSALGAGARLLLGARTAGAGLLAGAAAVGCGFAARLVPAPSLARYPVALGARLLAAAGGAPGRGRLDGDGARIVLVSRAGRLDPLLVAAAFRSPFVFADRTGFGGLSPTEEFLLEPLVAPEDGLGRDPSGGPLLHRMTAALEADCPVVSFADNPAGEPPERTRFRAEAFEAAALTGAPVVPVLLRADAGEPVGLIEGAPLGASEITGDRAADRSAVRAALDAASGRDARL